VAENILDERKSRGPFSGLGDFMNRVSISVEQLRILVRIGAFRFTGLTKKQLLWEVHAILGKKNKTEVVNELFEVNKPRFELPPLYHHRLDDAFDEKEILGFSISSPFHLLKETIPSSLTAADLQHASGNLVEITGYLVTVKYTRTKYGERMMFGTFLDQSGNFFDTTHFPKVCTEYPLRGKGCYTIKGKVAEEFGFYSIDVISLRLMENYTLETMDTTPAEGENEEK
jgi:DNA polymerase-3 subunit alpha